MIQGLARKRFCLCVSFLTGAWLLVVSLITFTKFENIRSKFSSYKLGASKNSSTSASCRSLLQNCYSKLFNERMYEFGSLMFSFV